jgi:hypothetical protein
MFNSLKLVTPPVAVALTMWRGSAFHWRDAMTFSKLMFKLLKLDGYAVPGNERPVKAGVRAGVVVLCAQKRA